MTGQPFKVGIVGLRAGLSWAAKAHVPALRALPADFEIAGVANSSLASGESAAAGMNLPKAFASVADMLAAPEIDMIAVTVRVAQHLEIVKAALEARKHVYCEWPLGNGLHEALELARIARQQGVLGVIGTQACVAPEIQYVKQLILDGFVGEVLSTTLIGHGAAWGGIIPNEQSSAYLLDNANGATMLTIPVGHTLAALREVLGDVIQTSSVLATRRKTVLVADSGEMLPVTAPDQVLVNGILASGVPVALHYRGGMPRDGHGLFWEINGTDGDLRLSGPFGHTQMVPLSLTGARGDEKVFQPLEVPASYLDWLPADPQTGNVARMYARMARDLREGTKTAKTFDDAVAIHRIIAAIEQSAESGVRTAA